MELVCFLLDAEFSLDCGGNFGALRAYKDGIRVPTLRTLRKGAPRFLAMLTF